MEADSNHKLPDVYESPDRTVQEAGRRVVRSAIPQPEPAPPPSFASGREVSLVRVTRVHPMALRAARQLVREQGHGHLVPQEDGSVRIVNNPPHRSRRDSGR